MTTPNQTPPELDFVDIFDNEDYLLGMDFDDYAMGLDGSLKNFILSKFVTPDTLLSFTGDLTPGDLLPVLDASDTSIGASGRFKSIDYRKFATINPWNDIAYGTGWTTYANGYYHPSYRLLGGFVHLRGNIKRSSGTGTTMATLPSGFRPLEKVRLPVLTDTGMGSILIATDGDIKWLSGGTGWMILDSLSFAVT